MNTFLIIVCFLLFLGCVALLFLYNKRSEKISELEELLNKAGSEAASSKRSLESLKREHESNSEQARKAAGAEVSELKKEIREVQIELESRDQSNAEKDKPNGACCALFQSSDTSRTMKQKTTTYCQHQCKLFRGQ